MKRKIKAIILFSFSILLPWPGAAALGAAAAGKTTPESLQAADLAIPFVPNQGQAGDADVAYTAHTFDCRVAVTRTGRMVYTLPQGKNKHPIAISETLVGPGVRSQVKARDQHAARFSSFPSRDRSKWVRGLPTFGQVELGQAAPGIQVALHAHSHKVEKFFFVDPGADPAAIRLAVTGADNLKVDTNGQLAAATPAGELRFSKPVAYQQINGQRRDVAVRYKMGADNTYGFALGPYDAAHPVIIDPWVWATTYYTESISTINMFKALAADADGNIYAGGTYDHNLVIFKLDSRLSTVLAQTDLSQMGCGQSALVDTISGLVLDSQGNVIVAGTTENPDFPVTEGCYDDRYYDDNDKAYYCVEGFIAKFSPDLQTLEAATFIGGDNFDWLYSLVVSPQNDIYVAGATLLQITSPEDFQPFPVTPGAWDTQPNANDHGKYKAVVAKLDSSLSTLLAATYLGGSQEGASTAYCMALDGSGDVWVAGYTDQNDFPVTQGCLAPDFGGEEDIFLVRLNPDLSQLQTATYLGDTAYERPMDILFDSKGDMYLAGWTSSEHFPMPAGGYDPSYGDVGADVFILKLSATADQLLAGTFLGGELGARRGNELPHAITLSPDESQLAVVGRTESSNFPTTADAYDKVIDNDDTPEIDGYSTLEFNDRDTIPVEVDQNFEFGDGFLAIFTSDLTDLIYSTYIGGGKAADYMDDVLMIGTDVIVSGDSRSRNFPQIPYADDYRIISRGVILRFNPDGDNDGDNTDNTDNNSSGGGGGGGGGGCFLQTCSCHP